VRTFYVTFCRAGHESYARFLVTAAAEEAEITARDFADLRASQWSCRSVKELPGVRMEAEVIEL
jgi:hypothetical protein